MIRISAVVAQDTQLQKAVRALQTGVPAAMKAIAAALHEHAVQSFRTESDPDGKKWEPLSETTLLLRAHGFHLTGPRLSKTKKKRTRRQVARIVNSARILVDKGVLLNSLSPKSGPRSASLTTNVPYASVHQFGNPANRIPNRDGGNPAPIPARRFMPLDESGKVVLPETLKAEIVATLREAILGKR